MKRDSLLYLNDILESIDHIQQYINNLTFEEFTKSNMVIDAVIRNFEIIGEASAHVPDDIQSSHPEIPWLEAKAMRNIMAHEYFRVDLKIVWKTAKESLPVLQGQIGKIIAEKQGV